MSGIPHGPGQFEAQILGTYVTALLWVNFKCAIWLAFRIAFSLKYFKGLMWIDDGRG